MTDLVEKSLNIVDEFYRKFFDIPFGNSEFQNRKFVMEAQFTPARGYRALGLRIHDRLRALQHAGFSIREDDIDIEELEEKILSADNKYDKRRLEVELDRKKASRQFTMKAVNDAAVEVVTMWEEVEKLPEYTREQFEKEEYDHFLISLRRQCKGITGAVDSLSLLSNDSEKFRLLREHVREQHIVQADSILEKTNE